MTEISVKVNIEAPLEMVWACYVQPEHIMNWNYATDDWHCPKATCDLRPGGHFSFSMASKNGEHEFDLKGTYIEIVSHALLSFKLSDDRKVWVRFAGGTNGIQVEQTFQPELSNTLEMQRTGWQSVLNNFKTYVESL